MVSKAPQKHTNDPTTTAHIEGIQARINTRYGPDAMREYFKILFEDDAALDNSVTRVLGERYKETTSQQEARSIMDSYCGVGDAAVYFNYSPSETELPLFAEVPLMKQELESIKHTHFLFAYLPRSIREMQTAHPQTVLNWEYYPNDETIDIKNKPGWHLLRKTRIQESMNYPLAQQISFLESGEELPTPDVLVYAILLHLACHKNKEQLFLGMKLRSTSDVIVGSHDSSAPHCLHLARLPHDHVLPSLGVTGIQKLRSSK